MRLGEWQRYFISCGNRKPYRLIKTIFFFLFLFRNFILVFFLFFLYRLALLEDGKEKLTKINDNIFR